MTTAVREGKWIVIEDIERAGNDVLSVLLPLLEGRPLELNGRGMIDLGKGGQLIATTKYTPLLLSDKDSLAPNLLKWKICSGFKDGLVSISFLQQMTTSMKS